MTHASLFSGIGGFDLVATWAGWENAFYCETDPFCRKILQYHFPKSTAYGDIKQSDFTTWRGKIDVLTGGFPCQPFSLAGKRKGTADNRYLWPEMLRAVGEIQPRWVVGENVLGIVNWSDGMVFEQVHVDLEAKGYEVASYILPACSVGAPHRRYRTWFVAHRADAGPESMRERAVPSDRIGIASDTGGDRRGKRAGEQELLEKCDRASDIGFYGSSRTVLDYTERLRRRDPREFYDGPANETSQEECSIVESFGTDRTHDWWRYFPTESPVCCGDDGLPERLDGITFPAWRRNSIKAYGNAVVPQVVLQIFRTINEYEQTF